MLGMIEKPLSGYGYYRWSSSAQTEGDSKERQTKRIAEFAKQKGIDLIDNRRVQRR
jgi:DNA invertase Pin-like site-specific DNA recombinase